MSPAGQSCVITVWKKIRLMLIISAMAVQVLEAADSLRIIKRSSAGKNSDNLVAYTRSISNKKKKSVVSDEAT